MTYCYIVEFKFSYIKIGFVVTFFHFYSRKIYFEQVTDYNDEDILYIVSLN